MQAQALAQTYRERYPELAASLPEGAKLGRPGKLIPQQQQEVIRTVRDGSKTAADAARLFGIHRSNINRLLARTGE